MKSPTQFPAPSRPVLAKVAGLLIAVSVFAEIVARLTGLQPYSEPPASTLSTLFQPDSLLGYVTVPGIEAVTGHFSNVADENTTTSNAASDNTISREELIFTHNESGTRVTEPLDNYIEDSPKDEVWFVGGGYTYGTTLPDEQTLPWITQSRLPFHRVVNLAAPGYDGCSIFLQIREQLEAGNIPVAVVVPTSLGFTRDTRPGSKALAAILDKTVSQYPSCRWRGFVPDVSYRNPNYRPIFLARRLAVFGALDKLLSDSRNQEPASLERKAANAILKLLRDRGVTAVVAGSAADSRDFFGRLHSEIRTDSLIVSTTYDETNPTSFVNALSAMVSLGQRQSVQISEQ